MTHHDDLILQRSPAVTEVGAFDEEEEEEKDFDSLFEKAGIPLRQEAVCPYGGTPSAKPDPPKKKSFGMKLLSVFTGSNKPYSLIEWNEIIGCQKPKSKLAYNRLKNTFYQEC